MKNNYLTDRGIMTVTFSASLMSLFLVEHIHKAQYQSRLSYNPMYKGSYGGEALIPLLIIMLGILYISLRKDIKSYEKH